MYEWLDEFPAAMTVCDAGGIILEMNERAAKSFEKDGGRALIGRNVLDCHPEPARSKLAALMGARRTNSYTTEKNGVWKFIHQAPWFKGGEYAGYVEIVVEIPPKLPHFVRT